MSSGKKRTQSSDSHPYEVLADPILNVTRIAPAAGLSPPRPAGKIIPQFDPLWRRTIPETYAAFAKAAEVLEATPMPKPKRMPRLLREISETVLDIPLDLGNWLQGFLPWEVPDGLYTTIAPNFFAVRR